MRLSRRKMLLGSAGVTLAGRNAGTAAFTGTTAFWERRVYGPGSVLPPEEALRRSGICPAWVRLVVEGTQYVIPFDSMESRTRAWDLFNTDPAWCVIRDRGNVRLSEVAVYPGGNIFEMSL